VIVGEIAMIHEALLRACLGDSTREVRVVCDLLVARENSLKYRPDRLVHLHERRCRPSPTDL